MVVPSTPVRSPTSVMEFPSPVLTGSQEGGAQPTATWTGRYIEDLFGDPMGEYGYQADEVPPAPLRNNVARLPEFDASEDVVPGHLFRSLVMEFDSLGSQVQDIGLAVERSRARMVAAVAADKKRHVPIQRCVKCKVNRVPTYNRRFEDAHCYGCEGKLRRELKSLKEDVKDYL